MPHELDFAAGVGSVLELQKWRAENDRKPENKAENLARAVFISAKTT